MRKLSLTLAIISITILTFSSCTKEYITNEFLPSRTFIYEIIEDEWIGYDHDAYVELQIRELDTRIMDQGAVTIALSTNGEKTFHTIPATINGIAYSFEYSRGKIVIKAQDPLYDPDIFIEVPELSTFKITLSDADYIN